MGRVEFGVALKFCKQSARSCNLLLFWRYSLTFVKKTSTWNVTKRTFKNTLQNLNDCKWPKTIVKIFIGYRTIRQIDYNFQLIHLHGIVSNIDERMNQQITDTQDDDETYSTLKGQEAANISAPYKYKHQRKIIMINIHIKTVTVVYHHLCSLANRGQSLGQTLWYSRQDTSINTNFTKRKSTINDSHSNTYIPSRIRIHRTTITQAHPHSSTK